MKLAFTFWQDLRRCVDSIAESLGAEDLSEESRGDDASAGAGSLAVGGNSCFFRRKSGVRSPENLSATLSRVLRRCGRPARL